MSEIDPASATVEELAAHIGSTEPAAPQTLIEALLAFQAEAPILTKDAQGEVKGVSKGGKSYEYTFKYAGYPMIMIAIQPLLTKYGLLWTCQPAETEQGRPVLDYSLTHVLSGESMDARMPLLLGANPTAQALGSALTYAKRQALTAVLNLVAEEDDDGKVASKRPTGDARPMPKAKRENMVAAIKAKGKDLAIVLGAVGLERVEDATVGHGRQVEKLLEEKPDA
jgi:hypothetical protein